MTVQNDSAAPSCAKGLSTTASKPRPRSSARALHAEVHNLSAFRCGQLFVGLAGFLYVESEGVQDGLDAGGEAVFFPPPPPPPFFIWRFGASLMKYRGGA